MRVFPGAVQTGGISGSCSAGGHSGGCIPQGMVCSCVRPCQEQVLAPAEEQGPLSTEHHSVCRGSSVMCSASRLPLVLHSTG